MAHPPQTASVEVRIVHAPTRVAGRRLCLFVSYAPGGRLKDHVRYHINALIRCGFDIVLLLVADRLPRSKLQRHSRHLAGLVLRRNAGFDFGAWADAFRLFPALWTAERVLLVNDSVFGPIGDFAGLMKRVTASAADLVGLTENHDFRPHIQSFFLLMNRRMLDNADVRRFWAGVANLGKREVIREYETKLHGLCLGWGLTCEALFPVDPLARYKTINRTIYGWAELIRQGFPYLKVELLRDFPPALAAGWEQAVGEGPLLRAIRAHLREVGERRPQASGPRA